MEMPGDGLIAFKLSCGDLVALGAFRAGDEEFARCDVVGDSKWYRECVVCEGWMWCGGASLLSPLYMTS